MSQTQWEMSVKMFIIQTAQRQQDKHYTQYQPTEGSNKFTKIST